MKKMTMTIKIILAILAILIILCFALLVGKFTTAYMGADLEEYRETDGITTASGDTLIFSRGDSISLIASTDNFTAGKENVTGTTNPSVKLVSSEKTNNATATYTAGFIITKNSYKYSTAAKTAELILTILDESGKVVDEADNLDYVTVNGVSGFDITEKTGGFNVVTNKSISTTSATTGTTHRWTYTLTFVNLATDQSVNETATLSLEAILQQNRIPETFAEICETKKINTFACDIARTEATDNTLLYHNVSLQNGANDKSYRYSGASDIVNNFVCFGTDESPCPVDNLYRIIGLFDDDKNGVYNAKLIKYDYATSAQLGIDGDYSTGTYSKSSYNTYKGVQTLINRYYWNNGTQTNTWSESRLNTINLNTNYINYLDNIESKWTSKIANTTWQVGGNIWGRIAAAIPSTAYVNEITTPVEDIKYNTKIGLMYVSDYSFAASQDSWILPFYVSSGEDYRTVVQNNWMYMGLYEWTIMPNSSNSHLVFNLRSDGTLNGGSANYGYAVRPVLYLESSVYVMDGDGSMSDPYIIAKD